MRLILPILAGAAALLAAAVPALARQGPAPADPAAIVARHSAPLSFERGRIAGPGAERLFEAAGDAQFVILAEYVSHIDHATPLFMAALFAELQRRAGFQYIAVEQDPVGMELLSTAPVRGELERIAQTARRYPYSVTFINDEELRLFAEVGRRSAGGWRPIWGIDQAFGTALPLEELVRLAPDPAAAAEAQALLDEARRREVLVPDFGDWRGTRDFETGHLISRDSVRLLPRYARLRELYRPAPGGRADILIRALEESAEIYSYYQRHRELGALGEPLGYYNNSVREQLMKDQFLANYRAAQAADGRLPRVLVKAGANHLVRGRNRTNVHTLGNMLHEFAIVNGMEAITIVMLPIRPEWPNFEAVPPELQALLPSRNLSGATLVDLRPLRNHLHAGQRFGLEADALANLRELAYGMDFALFLPSAPGSFALTAPQER